MSQMGGSGNPGLKWQCHENFLHLFHESNPPGSIIIRLKRFCRKIRFRVDTGIFYKLEL